MGKIRKVIAITTTIGVMIGYSNVTLCKDASEKFSNQVAVFTNEFVNDDVKIAAHRGFSSIEVENTTESIEAAADADYVDYVEMDVRLTKDDQLVLSHNNDVTLDDGTTVYISNSDYDDLTDYDLTYSTSPLFTGVKTLFNPNDGEIIRTRTAALNRKHYSIASLTEGLKAAGDKHILLDLKFEDDKKEFIKALNRDLDTIDCSNYIFQSLDLDSLLYLRIRHPEYTYLALLNSQSDLKYIDYFDYIGVKKELAGREEVIDAIDDPTKTVAVWTLNTLDDVERTSSTLGDRSKDVIYITDYPDVTAAYLNKKVKRNDKIKRLVR